MSPPGKKIERLGLRVTDDELGRLDHVVERVKRRNPHMDRSKVLREIIGFDSTNFVSEEDRLLLRAKFTDDPGDSDPERISRAS